MSLETLLEAARYLDYKTDAKKRGEEPYDYHTFSKVYGSSNDISSLHAQPSTKYQQSPAANSSHSSSHSSSEETRERRRSVSNVSRSESVSLNHEHGGAGTREVHNKLEKNRRAHLKECFEMLKKQLPNLDDRKTSNLSILRGAVRYIQTLKRKERESEHEMERLAREKIAFQQRLSSLKKEVSSHIDHVDASNFVMDGDDETTTTASECGALSDFDDDIPHDASTTSNQSFTAVSDTMNSSSNSTASCLLYGGMPNAVSVATMRQSSTLVSALPKQLSSSTLLGPPVENKGTAGLSNNVHFSSESPVSAVTGKTSLNSSDSSSGTVQNLSFSGSENSGAPTARVVSANSLHAMAGILTTPHAVQVITQPSGIKVITTPTSIPATQAAVQNISVGHQQGHIHILAPATTSSSAPSTPTAASKSHVGESLVQASSNPAINSCKQSLVSPVTLVSPQALVSITQVGTVTKPIIINQTSSLSELITSSITSSSLALSQGLVKTTSPTVSPSLAASPLTISMKNTLQNSSATSSSGTSNMVATLHVTKSHPQIIQPSSAAQNISNLLSAGGTPVNNVNRQVVTAAVKPLSTSAAVRSPLSHLAGVAHMVPQSSVATPVSQLVSPVSHVSAVTPLVGSVSVVSHAAAAVPHPQILSQSQSLGKVLASPILKSVNQIPIIQPQFLQQGVASGSTQPVVKPVVVVSVANVAPTSSVVPLSHTTAVVQLNDPQTAVQGSTQGSK